MKKIWNYLLLSLLLTATSETLIAQSLSMTASNYNGFNISCFGRNDGSINLTISGGTAPYSINWSNSETTEDISNLPAGYYRVTVDDADSQTPPVSAEITLNEPRKIAITAQPYRYPNGYEISVYGACNGSIDVSMADGVPPYTYAWNDGPTTQDRSVICASTYRLTVIDLNGCGASSESIIMKEPERGDWQLLGNTNSDPNNQFIGTTDQKDFVLKTFNSERLRIKSDGSIQFNNIQSTSNQSDLSLLYINSQGLLQKYLAPCPNPLGMPWLTGGNTLSGPGSFMGTCNYEDLVFKTFNQERCVITKDGDMILSDFGNVNFSVQPKLLIVGQPSVLTDPLEVRIFNNNTTTQASNLWVQNNAMAVGLGVDLNGQGFIGSEIGGSINQLIRMNYLGEIGISTDPQTGYKLVVDGKVGVRELFVKINGSWPDYVFESDHKLMPLLELKEYVTLNKRLPGMPSDNEIQVNGIDVSQVLKHQQEKIEELYLYIIELQKQITELSNH